MLLALCLATGAVANPHLEAIRELPPGEQYRQLSLMLLVSGGVEPSLGEALIGSADDAGGKVLGPDDYATPLVRVVDQRSMLQGTAGLFALARDHQDLIRARLDQLQADNPLLISRVDHRAITEDAIIIRGAIADAVSQAGLPESTGLDDGLARYREYTLYLRNVMEFQEFERDLAQLTGEAIASVGGQLDAYQRLFDDETGAAGFDGHIEAAESIYKRRGPFDPRAGKLTEEMIRNWVLTPSTPNP
jgi:hypothetical protein